MLKNGEVISQVNSDWWQDIIKKQMKVQGYVEVFLIKGRKGLKLSFFKPTERIK
tara:strand:- start:831 stop:992 length:162 start_codon:yes stop_codon:yes gene_type:complete